MGMPRQEYWSGLPFPSPGDLSNPGTELAPPAFFTTEPPGKSHLRRWEAPKYLVVHFYGLGISWLVSGRIIAATFWKGWRFSGTGSPPTFRPFMVSLRTVMVPVVCHSALRMSHSELRWGSKSSGSRLIHHLGSIWLVLTSLRHIQQLRHSFKGCALPPSLLSHQQQAGNKRPLFLLLATKLIMSLLKKRKPQIYKS